MIWELIVFDRMSDISWIVMHPSMKQDYHITDDYFKRIQLIGPWETLE